MGLFKSLGLLMSRQENSMMINSKIELALENLRIKIKKSSQILCLKKKHKLRYSLIS